MKTRVESSGPVAQAVCAQYNSTSFSEAKLEFMGLICILTGC
jgi:hypothetical protein